MASLDEGVWSDAGGEADELTARPGGVVMGGAEVGGANVEEGVVAVGKAEVGGGVGGVREEVGKERLAGK